MCDDAYIDGCPCAQNAQLFNEDRERMARFCALEWEVLDMLEGISEGATPLAVRLFELVKAHPLTQGGEAVTDILATDAGLVFWLADGSQHEAALGKLHEIKLAA